MLHGSQTVSNGVPFDFEGDSLCCGTVFETALAGDGSVEFDHHGVQTRKGLNQGDPARVLHIGTRAHPGDRTVLPAPSGFQYRTKGGWLFLPAPPYE